MTRPAWMISIGNFVFKYRDKLFPVIYVAAFLAFAPQTSPFMIALGFLVALMGQMVRASVIGFAYIKRGGLNKKVYAEDLVTTGIFGICRNPLYVGNLLIIAGLLLIHGNPALIALIGGLFLFIYFCIVFAEETYLENKFGEGFKQYCADVPRWLPKFDRLKDSTEGMTFNVRKVIVKDYATFASWMVWALVLLIYIHVRNGIPLGAAENVQTFLALLAVGLMALGVKIMKKRGILTF